MHTPSLLGYTQLDCRVLPSVSFLLARSNYQSNYQASFGVLAPSFVQNAYCPYAGLQTSVLNPNPIRGLDNARRIPVNFKRERKFTLKKNLE